MTNLILALYLIGGILTVMLILSEEHDWRFIGELCFITLVWLPLWVLTLYNHIIFKLVARKFKKVCLDDSIRLTTLFTNGKKEVFKTKSRWFSDLRFVLCGRKKQLEIAHYMGEFYEEMRNKNIIRQSQIGSMVKH